MTMLASIALVLLVLSNIRLLGGSRLGTLIQTVAIQGVILAFLPLFAHPGGGLNYELLAMAAATGLIKGLVLPRMLTRAVRDVQVRREVEPIVGYSTSLLVGLAALAVSAYLGWKLSPAEPAVSPLLVPVAIFTVLVGLFLIMTRRKALTQVVGYLVFENGIYTFGVSLAYRQPLLVELSVLLDVFVGVFVMGIIVFHIQREFDHIDADKLSLLRDGESQEEHQ